MQEKRDPEKVSILREIPKVDELLKEEGIASFIQIVSKKLVVDTIRSVLDEVRKGVLSGKIDKIERDLLLDRIKLKIEEKGRPHLRHLVNATGVIIHTNLGRSLLAEDAISSMIDVSTHYSNLEYDLHLGKRGSRYVHVEEILCELTGAEAATVVNNNAAAVLISLSTLAKGKEVIVSRGELVEIGGSFRIPDVMKQSGARLVEVGTTNKTHPKDYINAIGSETALLMKVHTSNYAIVGFTLEVSLKELVAIGREYSLPVIQDLGSGCFIDLRKYGMPGEPTVQETIKSGVDLVTFSGDKLLGGPQAGIILGKREFIEKIKKNPLNRAVRIDKLTLAALEATLRLYRDEERAIEKIPTLRLLLLSHSELEEKAKRLMELIRREAGEFVEVKLWDSVGRAGGGSLPLLELPSFAVVIKSKDMDTNSMEKGLRAYDPPIIARIEDERLLLDVRTLLTDDMEIIARAIRHIHTQKSFKDIF